MSNFLSTCIIMFDDYKALHTVYKKRIKNFSKSLKLKTQPNV